MATGQRDTEPERPGSKERQFDRGDAKTATDRLKQAATLVAGGVLLVRGLRRRSLRGIAMALAGGWLLSRGAGGSTRIRETLRPASETKREDEEATADDEAEADEPVRVSRSVTIGKPADELYETWRDPEQLSRIVGHVAEVSETGEDRLQWTLHGPGGRDVSWESRFVEDEPGELLRWESPEGAMVSNEGSVRFRDAPGDRGTVVTLSIDFDPPGGTIVTRALKRLDVVPEALVGTALDRFKGLAESGEISTLEGNPSGRGRGDRL